MLAKIFQHGVSNLFCWVSKYYVLVLFYKFFLIKECNNSDEPTVHQGIFR